jgi:hypothetical protein
MLSLLRRRPLFYELPDLIVVDHSRATIEVWTCGGQVGDPDDRIPLFVKGVYGCNPDEWKSLEKLVGKPTKGRFRVFPCHPALVQWMTEHCRPSRIRYSCADTGSASDTSKIEALLKGPWSPAYLHRDEAIPARRYPSPVTGDPDPD